MLKEHVRDAAIARLRAVVLHPMFSPLLNILGLITIVTGLVQVKEARRATALSSLSTIQQNYSESRNGFYDWLANDVIGETIALGEDLDDSEFENQIRERFEDNFAFAIAFRTRMSEMLYGIELACSLYIGGLLGAPANELVERFVRDDTIALTGFLDYDEKTGTLQFSDKLTIEWVHPGDDQDNNDTFPHTVRCLKEMNIIGELRKRSLP